MEKLTAAIALRILVPIPTDFLPHIQSHFPFHTDTRLLQLNIQPETCGVSLVSWDWEGQWRGLRKG